MDTPNLIKSIFPDSCYLQLNLESLALLDSTGFLWFPSPKVESYISVGSFCAEQANRES